MKPGGLVIVLFGVWALTQILAGDALGRLKVVG